MAVLRWVRRRVVRWSLAAALLVVLIWGRGVGVLHNGEGVIAVGAATSQVAVPEPPAASAAPAAPAETQEVPTQQAPTHDPASQGAATTGSVTVGSTGGSASAIAAPRAPSAVAIPSAESGEDVGANSAAPAAETSAAQADRAGSLASAVQFALEQGQVAVACRALQQLREHAGEAGRNAAASYETKVQQLLAHQTAQLAHAIAEGEIGAAQRQLHLLTEPAQGNVEASLVVLARGRNWPALTSTEHVEVPLAAGTALAGDRAVRWWTQDGKLARSRVVRVDGDRATLRLVGERGVTFPSVPVYLLEPESPTAVEATELGIAALQAGDVLRARLWCACALARGGGERADALRAALP